MGANNAVEMLEVAKQECGRLERENAKLKRNNFVYAEAFNVLAAERDAALAVRDELVMLIRTSPAEWSTSEGVDIIVRGVEEREMNETLAKSPTQSLAKHDAGIRAAERDGLLAIITAASLAAADSYRDDRNFGHDGSPYYNGGKHMAGIMRGILTTSPAQSLANLQAALVLEYIDGPEHAESLREAAEKAWVEARSHSDAFYDPALDEAINPYRKIEPERTFEELMQDDRIRYTARRDAKGCIRLSGGQGALVAGPEDTRVEVQAWFDRAGGAKWAAQYKAALNLIDKELAAEYRKTEAEGKK